MNSKVTFTEVQLRTNVLETLVEINKNISIKCFNKNGFSALPYTSVTVIETGLPMNCQRKVYDFLHDKIIYSVDITANETMSLKNSDGLNFHAFFSSFTMIEIKQGSNIVYNPLFSSDCLPQLHKAYDFFTLILKRIKEVNNGGD